MLIWREKKKKPKILWPNNCNFYYYVNSIIEICLGGIGNKFLEGIRKYVLSNFVFLFI